MTEYPDSFSNFPKSIREIKADQTGNYDDWEPRDAVIEALRRIDQGREAKPPLNLEATVVLFIQKTEDGKFEVHWDIQSKDRLLLLGAVTDLLRNIT